MNDDPQDLRQPLHHALGYLRASAAPPLRLAGADDEESVAAEPHIVRGID